MSLQGSLFLTSSPFSFPSDPYPLARANKMRSARSLLAKPSLHLHARAARGARLRGREDIALMNLSRVLHHHDHHHHRHQCHHHHYDMCPAEEDNAREGKGRSSDWTISVSLDQFHGWRRRRGQSEVPKLIGGLAKTCRVGFNYAI